jgi:hypothetical protein
MPYLHCPGCRLTVYAAAAEDTPETCPRCSRRLGAVRRLFPADARAASPRLLLRRATRLDPVISANRKRSPSSLSR